MGEPNTWKCPTAYTAEGRYAGGSKWPHQWMSADFCPPTQIFYRCCLNLPPESIESYTAADESIKWDAEDKQEACENQGQQLRTLQRGVKRVMSAEKEEEEELIYFKFSADSFKQNEPVDSIRIAYNPAPIGSGEEDGSTKGKCAGDDKSCDLSNCTKAFAKEYRMNFYEDAEYREDVLCGDSSSMRKIQIIGSSLVYRHTRKNEEYMTKEEYPDLITPPTWDDDRYQFTKQATFIIGPFRAHEVEGANSRALEFSVLYQMQDIWDGLITLLLSLPHISSRREYGLTSAPMDDPRRDTCEELKLEDELEGMVVVTKHEEQEGASKEGEQDGQTEFKLLSYNVWGVTPIFGSVGRVLRTRLQAEYVKRENPDAMIFAEVYEEWQHHMFNELLPIHCKNTVYSTNISYWDYAWIWIFGGGVKLCSKHEIVDKDVIAFDHPGHPMGTWFFSHDYSSSSSTPYEAPERGISYDFFVKRAAVYGKIHFRGTRFVHVFGTHLHASYYPPYDPFIAKRKKMLTNLRSFMDETLKRTASFTNDPHHKDLILTAGDFNIDLRVAALRMGSSSSSTNGERYKDICDRKKHKDIDRADVPITEEERSEYSYLLHTLQLRDMGVHQKNGPSFPEEEDWRCSPDHASFSSAQTGFLTHEDAKEHLDYVFLPEGMLDDVLESYTLRHFYPEAKMVIGEVSKDLSDHGALIARFVFKS